MENFLEYIGQLHKGWREEATRWGRSSAEPHQSNDSVTIRGSRIPWELVTNAGAQGLPASGPQFNNIL